MRKLDKIILPHVPQDFLQCIPNKWSGSHSSMILGSFRATNLAQDEGPPTFMTPASSSSHSKGNNRKRWKVYPCEWRPNRYSNLFHSYPFNINLPADTAWSFSLATKVRKKIRIGKFLVIFRIYFSTLKAFDARFSHRNFLRNELWYLCETKLSVPLANSK